MNTEMLLAIGSIVLTALVIFGIRVAVYKILAEGGKFREWEKRNIIAEGYEDKSGFHYGPEE